MTSERMGLSSHAGSIAVTGEIDVETAPQIDAALDATGADGEVRVDLSGVTFMDSSGLRVLISQHHRFDAAGGRLEVVRPSHVVMRLLEITALTDVLHVGAAD